MAYNFMDYFAFNLHFFYIVFVNVLKQVDRPKIDSLFYLLLVIDFFPSKHCFSFVYKCYIIWNKLE